MDTLAPTVAEARDGSTEAFGVIVKRFQDMAVGYSYSLLRDFHLAEDAAQEAFFEAFRNLPKLREPAAFPGWFRKIVFKQCDRILRRNEVVTVPLDLSHETRPVSEQNDMRDSVLEAVNNLPEHERITTMLFYTSGYSLEEIAGFLEVPVTTIKGRLHSAREHLREMLLKNVEEQLQSKRPSQNDRFAETVLHLLKAARSGDTARVKALLEADPRLIAARDPLGNTALIIAVNSGHHELARLLFDSGVQPDFHEAAAIGDTELVARLLDRNPALLNSFSREGFPALALAAHFGHADTVQFLLERSADIDLRSGHPLGVTPLHAALFGASLFGRTDASRLLIESGADVNLRRGGEGWPRAGWTALHYAAGCGFKELVPLILARGADVPAIDAAGNTALQVALQAGHLEIAKMLGERGAQ
ncbi:MAG: sigma-70 family RNA polymerase sigma factor [Acidobacteria bacterium]|nr:sigma-70 family RNA polymerase sigma factor [Acidobacteriota bacterium]